MAKEDIDNLVKISELKSYSRGINTIVKVLDKNQVREVTSSTDGDQHKVCEALVGDDTASIYLTLWDEAANTVEPGMNLRINNGYVNLFKGSLRLNIGRYGSYKILREAQFEDVNREKNLSSHLIKDERRRKNRRYM